jgi:hypothetical protein
MTTESKRPVSDEILARVITPVALHPRLYSNSRLARETRLATSTVAAAVGTLVARQWVSGEHFLAEARKVGRPQKLHDTTEVFEATVRHAVEHIRNDRPDREAALFMQAVVDRRQLVEALYVGEKMDDEAAARYIGRAVLLSEAYDLAEAGWLSGQAGWRSLVEIAADRPFFPVATVLTA